MEFHCQALEKIGFKGIDKIRDLNYQLVNSHMMDGDEYFDSMKVEDVIKEFREYGSTLPEE